ncbi:MAG: pilus assembly protein [Emcibacter sp.]|nr:pilus assembly protein [Emcibacter sp.]
MLINIRKIIIPRFIRNLKKSHKGTIIIEFALTFPIMLLLLLGGFETFRLLMAHRKSNMTVTSVSNLVSQNKTLSSGAIQNIFNAVENIMQPLELDENGQIFITYVTGTSGGNVIGLQCKGTSNASIASKIGIEGDEANLDSLPGNFSIAESETVVISEVIYHYEPIFVHFGTSQNNNIFTGHDIYQVAVQKPRYGSITFSSSTPCP